MIIVLFIFRINGTLFILLLFNLACTETSVATLRQVDQKKQHNSIYYNACARANLFYTKIYEINQVYF